MAIRTSNKAIEFAGDYIMDEILLVNHEGLKTDIKKMIVEFNIYESIYKNAVTGTIVISDTQNMIVKMPIQGTERLEFKLSTPGTSKLAHTVDATEETGHPFHIYKLTNKRQVAEGTMMYVLHFGSREFMRNLRVKVSQAYSGTMDDIVAQIFADKNYLDSRKRLLFEPTRNSDKIVIPNMRPFAAIDMICKKALAKNSKGAGYYFYETTKGFHFRSWESMCVTQGEHERPFKQQFQYTPVAVPQSESINKIKQDFMSVESYEFLQNFHDVAANQALGAYGHKVITHNIFDKSYREDTYNYHDYFGTTKHAESIGDSADPIKFAVVDTPVDYDDKNLSEYEEAKVTLQPTTRFLHDEDSGSFGIDVNADGVTEARRASVAVQVAAGTRVKLQVKGQSYLEPGDVIFFRIKSVDAANKTQGKTDPQYSGRYIISKIRHRIANEQYKQVIEAVKDGVHKPFATESMTSFPGSASQDTPQFEDLYESDGFTDPSPNIHA